MIHPLRSPRRSRARLARSAIALALVAGGVGMMSAPGSAATGDSPIRGTVYRDTNADGVRSRTKPGVAGVTVTATDDSGRSVSTTTGADGTYNLAVNTLGAGPFRLEFSGWPAQFRSGPHGANNATSVTTAAAGANVDFGVADPTDYCQNNPVMSITCFVSGQSPATGQTLAGFPYSAGVKEVSAHNKGAPGPAGYDLPNETTLANLGQTGSIWGQAWHRQSQSLYLGAYAKKHVPFGPGGAGAIYVKTGSAAPALFFSTGSTTNRTPPGGNWLADPWSSEIGKVGWGGMTVLGDRLYAVNLEDRNLYVFALTPAGALAGTGPAAKVLVPAPVGTAADSRPFAVAARDGKVYVGGVDSQEAGGGAPTGWVLRYDPTPGAFEPTPALTFSLNYTLGCTYVGKVPLLPNRCSADYPSQNWRRWGASVTSADGVGFGEAAVPNKINRVQFNPQPMLTGLTFADNGDLSIGIRDRWGDQSGRFIPGGTAPNPLNPSTTLPVELGTYTFGDTLRAAANGATFTLENNGTSRGVTGLAGAGIGPGGGSFFSGQMSQYQVDNLGVNTLEGHEKVAMGGIYQRPGTGELATAVYDVFGRWDYLGVRWMTDTGKDAPAGRDSTDLNVRAYSLYEAPAVVAPFGKANGLGDLEALCAQAPIELGDLVFWDRNANGRQDPGDRPIPGVTVTLRSAAGAALATAVTDDKGHYFFVSAGANNLTANPGPSVGVVAAGITASTAYTITFDARTVNPAKAGVANLTLTRVGGATPTTDSKAAPTGQAVGSINVTTGANGDNNHVYDAGYTGTLVLTAEQLRALPTVTEAPRVTAPLAATGGPWDATGLTGFGLVLLGTGMIISGRRRTARAD